MTGTPQSPPPSAGKLEKLVIAYAMRDGLAVARVRRWVSFMMLGGALDRAAARPGGPRFVLKGGVALELRMRERSRATEDLDVEAQSTEAELVTALDGALRDPYQDFTVARRTATRRLGPRAERVEIRVAYRSQRWATVQLDLTRPDGVRTEAEPLQAVPLTPFGLNGPETLPCLSLRYHIAQKFHAMTKVMPDGTPNERHRDAVDLLLLRELAMPGALGAIHAACEETFRLRAAHVWPPSINLPAAWESEVMALASPLGLPHASFTDVRRSLEKYNGVLIADSVGLGKSFLAGERRRRGFGALGRGVAAGVAQGDLARVGGANSARFLGRRDLVSLRETLVGTASALSSTRRCCSGSFPSRRTVRLSAMRSGRCERSPVLRRLRWSCRPIFTSDIRLIVWMAVEPHTPTGTVG